MQQFAFNFVVNEYNLDDFIESKCNKLANTIIENWSESLDYLRWGVLPYQRSLIIRGPKCSGKTFLAKKWAAKTNAIWMDTKSFNSEPADHNSIINASNNNFFVADGFDEQWLAQKFLHYFNLIHENGKYLLITLEKLPEIQLPDLSSRLNSINIIDIDFPDDQLIRALIFKLFSNYSVAASKEVINYLVRVLPRDFYNITQSVEKINSYAMANKHKITIPLIKHALTVN